MDVTWHSASLYLLGHQEAQPLSVSSKAKLYSHICGLASVDSSLYYVDVERYKYTYAMSPNYDDDDGDDVGVSCCYY